MAFPERLAIASRNPHKLRELGRICADWPVEWITVENHDPSSFPDVEETGATYLDNALLKATRVAEALDVPAIADGVESGELVPQDAHFTAAALVGAVGEILVGPLAGAPTTDVVADLVTFSVRSLGVRDAHP